MKKYFYDKRLYICLVSCFAFGLLCHGYCLFNKLSIKDDIICINSFGRTYSSGRWGLGIIEYLSNKLFSGYDFSLPTFNGSLVFLYISLFLYIVIVQLNINNKLSIILLSGLAISFPAVTSSFGYLFTAPSYYFGVLLSAIGAFLFYKYKNAVGLVACSFLMSVSVGIYQANISICISLLLIFMIKDEIDNNYDLGSLVSLILKNILICILFMLLYFGINTIFLRVKGIQIGDYVSDYGTTSLIGYLTRIIDAYIVCVHPQSYSKYVNMFNGPSYVFYALLLACLALSLLFYVKDNCKNKSAKITLLYAFVPLSSFFIFVMVDSSVIHSLMTFGYIFIIISLFPLLEINNIKIINTIVYVSISVLIILFAKLSNTSYLKANIMQENAINYFNRLITRIEMMDGYNSNMPIIYINDNLKSEEDFENANIFEDSYLVPYRFYNNTNSINNNRWKEFMKMWCGFNPQVLDVSNINKHSLEIINGMPCYPNDGSIAIIDDKIVVKFADNE